MLLVGAFIRWIVESGEINIVEVSVNEGVLEEREMAKYILIWHLNGEGALCANRLDGAANVDATLRLEAAYTSIQRNKRPCKTTT